MQIKYINCQNVRLIERNNLLIECFTLACLDLELQQQIQKTRVRDLTTLEHFTSIISRTIRGRSNMSIARMCVSLRGTICFQSVSLQHAWISSYSGSYNKTRVRDLTPLHYSTSIISRTIRGRSNMSIARMCASLRGTIYYQSVSLWHAWISSYSGSNNKTRVRDLTPLHYSTSIISRTIRGRSNMSIARMCASLREQSFNRVFHSSMPGSRVIVANIIKHV